MFLFSQPKAREGGKSGEGGTERAGGESGDGEESSEGGGGDEVPQRHGQGFQASQAEPGDEGVSLVLCHHEEE